MTIQDGSKQVEIRSTSSIDIFGLNGLVYDGNKLIGEIENGVFRKTIGTIMSDLSASEWLA